MRRPAYTGSDEIVVVPALWEGKKVVEIGNYAFQGDRDLRAVKLPDTVEKIGQFSFAKCIRLARAELPEGLSAIGKQAFSKCIALREVRLPGTSASVGAGAFADCISLARINIPKALTDWGASVFAYSGIEEIEWEEGVSVIGTGAFAATRVKTVVLPKGVRILPAKVFSSCTELESLTLSEKMIKIEDGAISGKTALRELIIPANVTDITEKSFSGCKGLQKLKFEGNAPDGFAIPARPYTDIDGYSQLIETQGDFTVCYHKGARGFTSPQWNGYDTELW